MNKACHTIYNKALGAFVAVSEHDSADGKRGGTVSPGRADPRRKPLDDRLFEPLTRENRIRGWSKDVKWTMRAIAGLSTVVCVGLSSPAAFAQFSDGGGTATGTGSVAIGSDATAENGNSATAIGTNTLASGDGATAVGGGAAATQRSASAYGLNSNASGTGSTALGGGA